MKNVYVIAHTHWDFEWYFTRQDARIQFIYHMDEVIRALKNNKIDYYLLDGQMSIIDDYLNSVPENKPVLQKFIKAGRLFVGPWYTQIDEMVTSGESIVRNLQAGFKLSSDLGKSNPIGYLPDSFGQGQDMPKIYNGFGIKNAVFWRGMPKEKSERYFYWTSDDSSKVLVANLQNGYPVGADLIQSDNYSELLHKITVNSNSDNMVLPVGGDQRPVDFDLKQRIKEVNNLQSDYRLKESTYPEYFKKLSEEKDLPTYSGEFVDPSTSKIHRGIYSSRADLKEIYDHLERLMTYEVEPLMAIADYHGINTKPGILSEIWKAVFRGQAHDSSGGCNSDETNQDIRHRGQVALQLALSLKGYLLRKLSSNVDKDLDIFFWNPTVENVCRVQHVTVMSRNPQFRLVDEDGNNVHYQVINQNKTNRSSIRRDVSKMKPDFYYQTEVALEVKINATDWRGLKIVENTEQKEVSPEKTTVENCYFKLWKDSDGLNLFRKDNNKTYKNFLRIEDSGDEGDTYDFSPAFKDWILSLDFKKSKVEQAIGDIQSSISLSGNWDLPADLSSRGKKLKDKKLNYNLELVLEKNNPVISFTLKMNNNILDHRFRLVIDSKVKAESSFADTPFGYIQRPVIDPHLKDWKEIGYHEEPTALRPFLHFANIHDDNESLTFIGLGEKDFQVIGNDFNELAITLFRGVGFLGRPDLLRRPSDASGLQDRYVPTPDSQLQGDLTFKGGIIFNSKFNPSEIQKAHHLLSVNSLVYQNQNLNKFTTRVQYFPINKNDRSLKHSSLIDVNSKSLVISSFTMTKDSTGYVLRVYNPLKESIKNPGSITFNQLSNVKILDLNHVIKANIGDGLKEIEMDDFTPGEIRTYGVYPIK